MSERVCKQCGIGMQHRRVGAIFCSKECSLLYDKEQRRARIQEKECVVCGKVFKPYSPRGICCSKECSEENKRAKSLEFHRQRYQRVKKEKEPRVCVICGANFIPLYSKSICCSNACSKQKNIETSRRTRQEKQSELGLKQQEMVHDGCNADMMQSSSSDYGMEYHQPPIVFGAHG